MSESMFILVDMEEMPNYTSFVMGNTVVFNTRLCILVPKLAGMQMQIGHACLKSLFQGNGLL